MFLGVSFGGQVFLLVFDLMKWLFEGYSELGDDNFFGLQYVFVVEVVINIGWQDVYNVLINFQVL